MKKTILALTLALSLQGLAAASAADNDYIMCPGDQLQVVVYGHEDLSSPPNSNTTPYTVRPDGKVTFPLIGDIDVTGKTVTEFTRHLIRGGFFQARTVPVFLLPPAHRHASFPALRY